MVATTATSASAYDITPHGYGQGTAVDGNNVPTGAVAFDETYGQYGAHALTSAEGQIVLTFDQGYENGYTAQILDTLKEKGVKAIFFLTGDYAKKEKALVQRMLDEGHTLGNHGMTHAKLPTLDAEGIEEEVMSLHEYVLEEYGYEMQYFRPPCGEFSEETLAVTQKLGYQTVLWSFAYVDWNVDCQPDPSESLDRIVSSAHDGAIYLLHSVSETNASVLGDAIDRLRAEGYTL
jgi:peptidoglycan-N-acetylmuramic acid deacetylase